MECDESLSTRGPEILREDLSDDFLSGRHPLPRSQQPGFRCRNRPGAGRRFHPQSPHQQLGYLSGIAFLPNGALLVADSNPEGSRIYEVRNGLLYNFAGIGGDDMLASNADGPAATARIREPGGLCASAEGTVFIQPNAGGKPLRKIDAQTRMVSTWAY
jgi:hypothetical protein